MFLFSIASKLGIERSAKLWTVELTLKYAGLDYFIMSAYKIFTVAGFLILIKNDMVTNNIYDMALGKKLCFHE